MKCACGSFIQTVGDMRCWPCCSKLIDAALVIREGEEAEIQRFIEIDIQHRALRERMTAIFLPRVERALITPESTTEERIEFALDVVRQCPDGLTQAIAADRVRQFKIENE